MMTGEQYKDVAVRRAGHLLRGRAGRRPPRPPDPRRRRRARRARLRLALRPVADGDSPLMRSRARPTSCARHIPMLHDAGMMAHVTYTSIMTLTTAAGRMQDAQRRSTSSGSTPTSTRRSGATSASPSASPTPRATAAGRRRKQDDPDAYVHVVDRSRDGVVHPRRQAAHHRRVARPRADDHPDQGDEGGRGGLRDRCDGAGERARREDRQHDLRAAPRRRPRLPGVGSRTTTPRAS